MKKLIGLIKRRLSAKTISFCFIGSAIGVPYFVLMTVISGCSNDNLMNLQHQVEIPKIVNTNPSFLKDIQPILAKYQCANCHGTDYYAYPGVKSLAESGELYGTMAGIGYKRMPLTGYGKVSAEELVLIKNWIDNGEKNN